MTTSSIRPRWFFYPVWAALTAISIPIAALVTWLVVSQIENVVGGTIQMGGRARITEDYLSSYILIPVLGVVAGFLQYLLLRRHLARMGWWIAATTLGLLTGLVGGRLILFGMHGTLDATWLGVLATALIGGSMGLAQWLVMSRRVRHAAWWIAANVLGWGIVGWGAETLSNDMVPAIGLILVPGIATSVALWLLLDRLPQLAGSGSNPPPGGPERARGGGGGGAKMGESSEGGE
jgi:hypothetical protein